LSADTVVDQHLDPYRVTLFSDPRHPDQGPTWYLQTSPEFHMKRLVAAGADAIYQITQAFRACERGPLHNIEFTIAEWYRVGDGQAEGMELLSELMLEVADCPPARLVSYAAAFQECAGIDPFFAPQAELERLARSAGRVHGQDDRDELLQLILNHTVIPQFSPAQPTILYDFPPTQAALARVRQDDPPVAERFELYYQGMELANGYHELRSPDELRSRQIETNRRRARHGKPPLPLSNRLLPAMESEFPPCTGVALGVDRLLLTILSEKTLDSILAFPADRA
jgi:lysyl-tRNA synthetase class 2